MIYYHQQRKQYKMNVKFFIVGDRGEVTYVWKAEEKNTRGFNAKIVGIYIKQTRKFLLRNL